MKNYIKPILAIVLVAAMAVGGTLAYLSDTEEVTNTFTVGEGVQISLVETVFGDEIDTENGINSDAEGSTLVTVDMIPGDVITKNPTITVEGKDCYIFVDVIVANNEGDESGVTILGYEIDDDWEEVASAYNSVDGTTTYVYTAGTGYPVAVGSDDETTSFGILDGNEVTINSSVTREDLSAIKDETVEAPTLSFVGYAIQAANLYDSADEDTDTESEQAAAVIAEFLSEFGKVLVSD